MTLISTNNPFKIRQDMNLNNLSAKGLKHENTKKSMLMEALKELPIDFNKSVNIDSNVVKSRVAATAMLSDIRKTLRLDPNHSSKVFVARSIKNPITKAYEGTRVFRIN